MLARRVVVMFALALAATPGIAEQNKGKVPASASKERYQCQVGPLEKQTRLVMETVKGKPVYLAYWSSNGPFQCSFESWPNDGRAKWVNSASGMLINLISGTMLIKREPNQYIVRAQEVDRMTYCGTDGVISGILTVPMRKGKCTWVETSASAAGN